ncbi:small ribosomal subunit Rsm22 family protein [Phenylobacterium immobile]|uniref:small ribosomal subunit Rsm22 family protein n=1 Tax=Phenylobacterium immobile TaxID=21 RepID=UPI000A5ED22F|nr:small ribosomal subunit Rsm22 family protein [Phenylobacterium immobile]
MAPELPGALRAAIDAELQGVSRRDLADRAAETSDAYRAGKGSAGVIRGASDALAYALARMPATYAACAAVFNEAQDRAPAFAPGRLLDAGCGPGGASWAAIEAWPQIETVTWRDSSPLFLDLAARLAAAAPVLGAADVERVDLTGGAALPAADLVVASYALAEIAADKQAGVVGRPWAACEGLIALIEPGTSAGYARILAARSTLIEAGAQILGPCPHEDACPLPAGDWCHFVQRLPRSRDHQLAKRAQVNFEDEKYAYVLAARPGVVSDPTPARVLARPVSAKPGVTLKLCTPQGLEQRFVGRREKAAYAVASRRDWGDVFAGPEPER